MYKPRSGLTIRQCLYVPSIWYQGIKKVTLVRPQSMAVLDVVFSKTGCKHGYDAVVTTDAGYFLADYRRSVFYAVEI